MRCALRLLPTGPFSSVVPSQSSLAIADIEGPSCGWPGQANADLITIQATSHAITPTDALTADDAAALIRLIGAAIAIVILAIAGIVSAVGDTRAATD